MMGPLSGLRVMKVIAFITAPLGAMALAQLGEHGDAVLVGVLGLSTAAIGKLHGSGIVAGPEEG